jgi:hypothetical protein
MRKIIYITLSIIIYSCHNNNKSVKTQINKIDTLKIYYSTIFDTTGNFVTNIGKKFNASDFNGSNLKNDKNLNCFVSFRGPMKKYSNKIDVEIRDFKKLHEVKKINNYNFKIIKSLKDTSGTLSLEFFIKPKKGYIIKYLENNTSKEIEYYNSNQSFNLFVWTNNMEKKIN